jgi:hypothetical protein
VRVAAERLGRDAAIVGAVSAAATELKKKYESGQAAVQCFALVCVGFTMRAPAASWDTATRTEKRKFNGQPGGRRIKRETNERGGVDEGGKVDERGKSIGEGTPSTLHE